MSWLVVLCVAVAGVLYVGGPLIRPGERREDPARGLGAELDARKRAALVGIVDLEGERAVGKLNDEDFAALRSEYEAEALVAIAELDQLHNAGPEHDVEREIAELKARLAEGEELQ
ncbi:MAG: hypothetical protein QOD46_381 [Actinomycetota bacterium]|jgi:hypothetical protein|nr:hypothetical protein [Actinomycetota bacterium]